jgi:hypothetical protein
VISKQSTDKELEWDDLNIVVMLCMYSSSRALFVHLCHCLISAAAGESPLPWCVHLLFVPALLLLSSTLSGLLGSPLESVPVQLQNLAV